MSPATSPLSGVPPATIVARAFEELGISPTHDPATERAAIAWHEKPGLDDPALENLTALAFVTIDNPGSRDLDQALLIERDGADYRVRYALADAAHYVRPGAELFAEALERGCSYYTPLAVAPMLPRSLSEDLVSLGPDIERRAIVFDMRLDRDARTLGTRVLGARIRSRAQLTYAGVQAFLDGAPREEPRTDARDDGSVAAGASASASHPIDAACTASLRLLREVGTKLSLLARERGAIAFDRRDVEITVAGVPPRLVARERARLDVEEWNAQISLLCNSEGAALLAALDARDGEVGGEDANVGTLEPIYRVHDAPLGTRLAELRRELDAWVTATGLGDVWRWKKGASLADYLDALPGEPRERGRVRAVQRQVLVRQRASEFRAEPGRHHALATERYARFSSPMREVVGIYTHRELLAALEGRGRREPALRDAVIDSANAAKRRQKALDKALGLKVIADLLDTDLTREPVPSRAGTVLGVRAGSGRSGGHLYVGLDDLALDLKVSAADLERRHGTAYTFEALSATPVDPRKPAFALGDAIAVRAVGFDDASGRFRLDAVPRGEAARRERRRARQG